MKALMTFFGISMLAMNFLSASVVTDDVNKNENTTEEGVQKDFGCKKCRPNRK
ncbi:MAG: hypothetical protein LW832_06940 [Parachlamydia sp.]|jgi:hypothetical protein|nr:hypothetical protein [Parachlamydia sp.]